MLKLRCSIMHRELQSRATPTVFCNLEVLQNLLWIILGKFWRTSKLQLLLLFYSCQPMYVHLQEADLLRLYSLYLDSNILQNVERWKDWLHIPGYDTILFMYRWKNSEDMCSQTSWYLWRRRTETFTKNCCMYHSLFCFISRSRDQ